MTDRPLSAVERPWAQMVSVLGSVFSDRHRITAGLFVSFSVFDMKTICNRICSRSVCLGGDVAKNIDMDRDPYYD
jgi:hypothetical protein